MFRHYFFYASNERERSDLKILLVQRNTGVVTISLSLDRFNTPNFLQDMIPTLANDDNTDFEFSRDGLIQDNKTILLTQKSNQYDGLINISLTKINIYINNSIIYLNHVNIRFRMPVE